MFPLGVNAINPFMNFQVPGFTGAAQAVPFQQVLATKGIEQQQPAFGTTLTLAQQTAFAPQAQAAEGSVMTSFGNAEQLNPYAPANVCGQRLNVCG